MWLDEQGDKAIDKEDAAHYQHNVCHPAVSLLLPLGLLLRSHAEGRGQAPNSQCQSLCPKLAPKLLLLVGMMQYFVAMAAEHGLASPPK